ncbi:hypothetical protein ACWGR4_44935 [Embleya sp. NPDC055664]
MTDRREGDGLVPNRRGTELAMLGFAVLAGHDPERDGPLAEEVVRDTWLGFAPADEDEDGEWWGRLGWSSAASKHDGAAPGYGKRRRA